MTGDLKISFKPVPTAANKGKGYIQMTASVNGTRFRMALKQIVSCPKEELASVSSTLFRIYKEALLQNKHITAQALKKQYLSVPPTLLCETLRHSNNDTLINIGKTITYEQYRLQLKTVKLISIFCQLTYGIPDLSISALPENFLRQIRDFFNRQQPVDKNDIGEQIRFVRSALLREYRKGNIELSSSLKEQLTGTQAPGRKLFPEDIRKLAGTHLPKHLAVIRNAFIFSCLTGLTYNAIKQLTRHQLRIVSDQSLWLFTDKQQYPLSALPEDMQHELLKRDKNVPLFKLPTIQHININLRSIAIKSDIHADFTFKSARTYYLTQISQNFFCSP